jgi:ribosomal protein S18 acetylase RimI-like enzyme
LPGAPEGEAVREVLSVQLDPSDGEHPKSGERDRRERRTADQDVGHGKRQRPGSDPLAPPGRLKDTAKLLREVRCASKNYIDRLVHGRRVERIGSARRGGPVRENHIHRIGRDPNMLDRLALRARYDREMRQDPPVTTGVTIDRTPPFVRERNSHEMILFSSLSSDAAPAAVHAEAERARAAGRELEWKVYEHDLPSELPALLRREGFVPDEPETLVVLDLSADSRSDPSPAGPTVREVSDASTFADALGVSAAAFGPEGPEHLLEYRDRLSDPTARLFVAYLEDRPVAAGRLELPPGRSFAGLWGGGTVPEARHRGVYRALVRARAEYARERGYRYVTVDARETSRPILERIGFARLSGIQGWLIGGAPGANR